MEEYFPQMVTQGQNRRKQPTGYKLKTHPNLLIRVGFDLVPKRGLQKYLAISVSYLLSSELMRV